MKEVGTISFLSTNCQHSNTPSNENIFKIMRNIFVKEPKPLSGSVHCTVTVSIGLAKDYTFRQCSYCVFVYQCLVWPFTQTFCA